MREWYLVVFKSEALEDPEKFLDAPFRAFESLYVIENIGPIPPEWESRQISDHSLLYYCSREQLIDFLGNYTYWVSPLVKRGKGEKPVRLQKVSLDSMPERKKFAILGYKKPVEDRSKYMRFDY